MTIMNGSSRSGKQITADTPQERQWYVCLGMALADSQVRDEVFEKLYTSAAPPEVQQMLVAIKTQDRVAAERAAVAMGFSSQEHSFVKGLIEELRTRYHRKQLRERLQHIGRMSLLVGEMDEEELLQKAKEVLDGALFA